jgi:hypothetical protein
MLKKDLYQVMHFIIKTINDENGKETAEFNVKDYEGMFDSKSPKESHDNWMNAKIKDGWIYGEVKDVDKKTHPCLIPYEKLPYEEKIKDWISLGITRYWNEINLITDVEILRFSICGILIVGNYSEVISNLNLNVNANYCEFNYTIEESFISNMLKSKDNISIKISLLSNGKKYIFSDILRNDGVCNLLEKNKNTNNKADYIFKIRLSTGCLIDNMELIDNRE